MLRTDPAYAAAAARISALTMDICEYLAGADLPCGGAPERLVVAYHAACSLQHGQKVVREPKDVLSRLGFLVKDVPEGHLCCGSAGTYNILEPDIAKRLRARKVGISRSLRRGDRRRQYRLHHANRGRHGHPVVHPSS